jgi:hypothetical protein
MMFVLLTVLPVHRVSDGMRYVRVDFVQHWGRIGHRRWLDGEVLLRVSQVVEIDVLEMGYVWARIGEGRGVEG